VEVVGMEEDVISLSELFTYRYTGEGVGGALMGVFESRAVRPRFLPRLEYFGLADAFMTALGASKQAA
jgi:pilus assembly protein CpaF